MKKIIVFLFLLPSIVFGQMMINYSTTSGWVGGLDWNQTHNTIVRTGDLTGESLGASPGNAKLPVHAQMRGCLLLDNGTVNYYLDPADWNKKANGTASNLTGEDGQVMVQIPKFYVKYTYLIADGDTTHQWLISNTHKPGFSIHPAFYKDNAYVNYRYISAYKACLYDVSSSRYANSLYIYSDTLLFSAADSSITIGGKGVPTHGFTVLEVGDRISVSWTDNNNTTFIVKTPGDTHIHVTVPPIDETAFTGIICNERDYTATTGDKLSSVSGKIPLTRLNRSQARTLAKNRGAGWRQLDYYLLNAIQILFLVEFAKPDAQEITSVGPGITAISYAAWWLYSHYNPYILSGNGNSIGNVSGDNAGSSDIETEKSKYSKFRGIESFYGYIATFVDGINFNWYRPYVTNNSVAWADDTSVGYRDVGYDVSGVQGWQRRLGNCSEVIFPSENSSNWLIRDYYHPPVEEWAIAISGGASNDGTQCGMFAWYNNYNSNSREHWLGTRLSY